MRRNIFKNVCLLATLTGTVFTLNAVACAADRVVVVPLGGAPG